MKGLKKLTHWLRATAPSAETSADGRETAVDNKPLLETPYDFGAQNDPIALGIHNGRLTQNSALVCEGPVSLSLTWLPTPNVRFRIAGGSAHHGFAEPGEASLELDLGEVATTSVFVGRVLLGSTPEIDGSLSVPLSVGDQEPLDAISFMLANTPQMFGDWIQKSPGGWVGRVVVERPPWRVTVEPRRDAMKIVGELRALGGFAITHVGRVERLDATSFSTAEAREILEYVNLFFSFARGLWTPPLLPVGYRDGAVVWREWGGRTSSPWKANLSWFSPQHPDALVEGFPNFFDRLHDPQWHDSLTLAIWWYIEANGPTTAETSLLLSQAVLELLSWVILVREQGAKSNKAHKDARAEDNIRDLLKWAQIPVALPAELGDLGAFASAQGWADGPAALIGFRNKLTHPGGKASAIFGAPPLARIELQQLGLWYVELALLRFQNYDGDYINRLTKGGVGDVEGVPWP